MPGDGVFAILKSFEDLYNGTPLLSDEEAAMLQNIIEQHTDIEVTTPLLMQLVAEKTKAGTPPASPRRDSDSRSSGEEDSTGDDYARSRTSSNESMGDGQYPRPMSRPPSRGPTTPSIKSPLDSERRQRSTPLNAPSSWSKRPTRAGRRKSDAGNRSDSEVCGMPPI